MHRARIRPRLGAEAPDAAALAVHGTPVLVGVRMPAEEHVHLEAGD